MPQMKPMNWLFIMFLIIICLTMIFILIFFSVHPRPYITSTSMKNTKKLLWQWSW